MERGTVYASGGLEPFFALCAELDAGRSAVLCVVIETIGSTPQVPGAMMLCTQMGTTVGTVGGGGCLEAEIRRQARDLLLTGGAVTCRLRLDHDLTVKDGMICGGEMMAIAVSLSPDRASECHHACERLRRGESAHFPLEAPEEPPPSSDIAQSEESSLSQYLLSLEPDPRLIIAGAGHVGVEVAWQAHRIGFAVTVLDDRADFLCPDRFPMKVTFIAAPIPATLASLAPDPTAYVVIATRGHKDDLDAIATVVRRPLRYLGMLGSRRKIVTLFKELRALGATDDDLARIATPIGLDVGALTPAEIATSIVAQIIQVRRRGILQRESRSPPFVK